ncbi:MAG: LysR family transcriptional regulator [Pseudomonadota bacterium]
MNWQAVAFDWNHVRAFLATAEQGSLSAAARALQTTQPTIGRQIAALESTLGITLFERGGRSLLITSAGQDLLNHVRAMGDAASRISLTAAGQAQDGIGRVTVTASDLFAAGYLPPVIKRLQHVAPGITVDIVASNRVEDLTRREADIAVRHVPSENPELIVKRLPDYTAGFYACADYIAQFGRPHGIDDLSGHRLLGPRDTADMLAYLARTGISLRPDMFNFATDSGMVMWEMMRAGLGIAVLPDGLWPDAPDVSKVLSGLPPIPFPAWLVTHRELHTSHRIRMVFDALADGLGHKSRSG